MAEGGSRRRILSKVLLFVWVIGPIVGPAGAVRAQSECGDRRYRLDVASEDAGYLQERRCAVVDILIWGRLTPLVRQEAAPTDELGPRFIMVVTELSRGGPRVTIRQDLYPQAAGGPLVYSAPGQIFSHPAFGGRYTIPGGWAEVDVAGPIANLLRDEGVPLPESVSPPSPQPSGEPPGTTSEPTPAPSTGAAPRAGPSPRGPDVVTLLFVGAVAAGIVVWLLRRRPS